MPSIRRIDAKNLITGKKKFLIRLVSDSDFYALIIAVFCYHCNEFIRT